MSDTSAAPSRSRSAASLLFEKVARAACRSGSIPKLTDIDFAALRAYAPWIAIIDPDNEARTLRFSLAGAGLSKFIGHDLLGVDYLDIVDPTIKGDAYDSVFLMMSRPCGLWQTTPALTLGGERLLFEYTGFPVLDHVKGVAQIMFLIHRPDEATSDGLPRIARVQHSTEWRWLEMRDAVVEPDKAGA